MRYFIANIFFSMIMTYFVLEIYHQVPSTALYAILIFSSWFILSWLFSYFYYKRYFFKLPLVVELLLYYMKELWVASLKVAHDIVTPKDHMKPGVLAIPLDARTDLEITLLAIFITLTPGTLSLDISEDKKKLYVHEVYIKNNDLEAKKKELKDGFERRILKITR